MNEQSKINVGKITCLEDINNLAEIIFLFISTNVVNSQGLSAILKGKVKRAVSLIDIDFCVD